MSIDAMKAEALLQEYGNIEDYLVTVELTPENFDEYFEFVTIPSQNAFGEPDDTIWYGLRSKKMTRD